MSAKTLAFDMASPDPAATEAARGRDTARKEDASAATTTAAAAAGLAMPVGRRSQGGAPIMRRPSPAARRNGLGFRRAEGGRDEVEAESLVGLCLFNLSGEDRDD